MCFVLVFIITEHNLSCFYEEKKLEAEHALKLTKNHFLNVC